MAAWISQHYLTLSFLSVYLALMVYHAWLGKAGTKNLADYYVGGRSMGGVAIGLSFFATFSSTNSFIGFSGQAYSYGIAWLLIVPFTVGLTALSWFLVAPRLRRFTGSLQSLTIPDFIGFRYGSPSARIAAALIVSLASILYMVAVFKGVGTLFQAVLGVHYQLSILLILIIVMGYTAVGGFLSVVKTDVVQGSIMGFAALLMLTRTVQQAGGLESIGQVQSQVPELWQWDTAMPLSLMLGVLFATTVKMLVEPRQLSRFYALKDRQAARRGAMLCPVLFLLVYSLLVPIGLYAHQIIPTGISDTDEIIPNLIGSPLIFSSLESAFLVVALFAAAMSSLDSVLLVVASTCQRDLLGSFVKNREDAGAIRSTRILVLVFASVTALIALWPPGGIVALTSFSGSLFAACFLPVMLLGLHWRRGNPLSVLTSMGLGILFLATWDLLDLIPSLHRVFAASLVSLGSYALISATTTPHQSQVLDELFENGSD